jgi:hypothetical protein
MTVTFESLPIGSVFKFPYPNTSKIMTEIGWQEVWHKKISPWNFCDVGYVIPEDTSGWQTTCYKSSQWCFIVNEKYYSKVRKPLVASIPVIPAGQEPA